MNIFNCPACGKKSHTSSSIGFEDVRLCSECSISWSNEDEYIRYQDLTKLARQTELVTKNTMEIMAERNLL